MTRCMFTLDMTVSHSRWLHPTEGAPPDLFMTLNVSPAYPGLTFCPLLPGSPGSPCNTFFFQNKA